MLALFHAAALDGDVLLLQTMVPARPHLQFDLDDTDTRGETALYKAVPAPAGPCWHSVPHASRLTPSTPRQCTRAFTLEHELGIKETRERARSQIEALKRDGKGHFDGAIGASRKRTAKGHISRFSMPNENAAAAAPVNS